MLAREDDLWTKTNRPLEEEKEVEKQKWQAESGPWLFIKASDDPDPIGMKSSPSDG